MKNNSCCYKLVLTLIVSAILVLVGYISFNFAERLLSVPNGENTKIYPFHILFLYVLFLIFVAFVVKILFASAKYFSKLDCLNEITEENSETDKEVFKKYCDTLAEL